MGKLSTDPLLKQFYEKPVNKLAFSLKKCKLKTPVRKKNKIKK